VILHGPDDNLAMFASHPMPPTGQYFGVLVVHLVITNGVKSANGHVHAGVNDVRSYRPLSRLSIGLYILIHVVVQKSANKSVEEEPSGLRPSVPHLGVSGIIVNDAHRRFRLYFEHKVFITMRRVFGSDREDISWIVAVADEVSDLAGVILDSDFHRSLFQVKDFR
jgi:hypothetical protein